MYLLPKPHSMEFNDDKFIIVYQTKIIVAPQSSNELFHFAKILKQDLVVRIGFSLPILKGDPEKGSIYLEVKPDLTEQEYILQITPERILIQGGDEAAVLYGIQTLRQIVSQEGAVLPCMLIKDYPEIKNRGYYLDVTRGRIPTLSYLKAFADQLSYYKINQLQLYVEHSYLFQGLSEVWRDDTPLTAEEILELDAYCNSLQIELVPSIATFGHLYKLLTTKTYSHLCELPDSDKQPFAFEDRMMHHTIDASNEESLTLIKRLIDEYLPLFQSKHFNICADETFDLGKGRSKSKAQEQGIKKMYMTYVKELCSYLVRKGKRPMFWGDVIIEFPEAIKELPEETICLNWGYAPNQGEESTRLLHQAGATQYLCPGVGGWNQFINLIRSSYENITRMSTYAHRYNALGVLNTDWGDFGHINHPEFSTAGMIYGAAFSWNQEVLPFEEINRQISVLAYEDKSQRILDFIAALSTNSTFDWYNVVRYMEMSTHVKPEEEKRQYFANINMTAGKNSIENIREGIRHLYEIIKHLDSSKRVFIKPYIVAAEGMIIFNKVGASISQYLYHIPNEAAENPGKLAVELENWFHSYKEVWRSVSKESELYRLQAVVNWYADLLREV